MIAVKKQSGAALVVSLVILAVITIMGVAGMQDATLQMKISASQRDRALAFEAAEAVLRSVERGYIKTPPAINTLTNCSGSNCFTDTCTQGRCFEGSFDGSKAMSCSQVKTNAEKNLSGDSAVWNTTGSHLEEEYKPAKDEGGIVKVKYIVEFLCFSPSEDGAMATISPTGQSQEPSMAPMYRISTLSEGPGSRSKVMLQSIIKINFGS
jgi:type IV pilus assembly protein PilX